MRHYKVYYHHRDIESKKFTSILDGICKEVVTTDDECEQGDIIVLFENELGIRTGREYRGVITSLHKKLKGDDLVILKLK